MITFCLDTSVYIESWRRRYPIDVFPSFWQKLDEWAEEGLILSTEEVRVEIEKVDDDLLKWIKGRKHFFRPLDEEVQEIVITILNDFPELISVGKNRSMADPWVVAQAKVTSSVVVTEELPSDSVKKPKIPNICNQMGVRFINTLDLIRRMELKF